MKLLKPALLFVFALLALPLLAAPPEDGKTWVLTFSDDFDGPKVDETHWADGVCVIPAEVLALVEARKEARQAKDFAKADALRDEIAALGWEIRETRQGTQITKKG